jgi:hypothetical protein
MKWNNLASDRDEGWGLVNTTVKHCFMLVFYLVYSQTLTLKMEATCTPKRRLLPTGYSVLYPRRQDCS